MRPRFVGSVIVDILFFWVATGFAIASLWPVYQAEQFLLLAVVAVALGTLIGVVGTALRWPAYAVMLATFLGFLLVGVPLAVPDKAQLGVLPTLEGLADLLSGVALGWRQLLTITLPVGSYQALLVPALVLVLVGTVAGISIALRTKYGELASVIPAGMLLVGILFGPAVVPWPVPLALGLLATLLLWSVWRRSRRRREAIRLLVERTPEGRQLETAADRVAGLRTLLAGLLILALAGSASVAATTAFPPSSDRDVLRTVVEQPFDPRDYASPLAGFRAYLRDAAVDATMLRVTGLPDDARIRLATLDSYDGVVYAVGSAAVDSDSGTFVRVPTTVDQSDVDGEQATVDVEVEGYRGVWVPTVGALQSIDFQGAGSSALQDSFYLNETTGTAAVIDALGAGDAYRQRGVVAPPAGSLAAVAPGTDRVPRLDELPDGLSTKIEEYAGEAASPGQRLSAVIEGLRAEGYISHGLSEDEPPSRSGHAADRVTELLTGTQMIGDAEQYAVTAALMARQIGFPARVVFGFAPGLRESGPSLPGEGTIAVTGADISAWIEVSTADRGWVAVDPVPPVRPIPTDVEPEPEEVARPQTPVQPPPDEPDRREEQSPPDSTQDDPDSLDPFVQVLLLVLRVLAITVLVALLLASPFLVVIGAKLRRRRLRRRSGTPVQQISGGWDEFRDAMVDRGYTPAPAATRIEIARASPLEQSRTLASVADRAVFGPGDPAPEDAERVWRVVAEMRGHLDRGRTRRQRLAALISARSLAGYSVKDLFAREARPAVRGARR